MTDEDNNLSPDDALEEVKDQDYNIEAGRSGELPEDNERPFTPADDTSSSTIPLDHPQLDSSLDEHELYDEGITNAAGIDDQHEVKESRDQSTM